MTRNLRLVDPRTLLLPTSRRAGADLFKLYGQIARFGASDAGMPAPEALETAAGELVCVSGVTRATRIAKLAPGRSLMMEVIGRVKLPPGPHRTIGDTLPSLPPFSVPP